MRWRTASFALLFAAALVSAVGVVYSKHEARKLFIELQALQARRDDLGVEWGRLQLEQSTWAAHGRIEEIASERLHMHLPSVGSIVAVEP
jgi:cell division protein FtsL